MEYPHTNPGSVKIMKAFYECERMMTRIPLAHIILKVLISLLSYIPGTRELALRVVENSLKLKLKANPPKGKGRLYNLLVLYLCTSPLNFKCTFPVSRVAFHTA